MPILRIVVAKVGVSEESGSCVFVVSQMICGKTKSRVIHVVVVNLLRVHGAHQISHRRFLFLCMFVLQEYASQV